MLKKLLLTLAVAMAPVVELRGAIPMGVGLGLNVATALVAAVIGNMIPVPFIILFIRPIFAFLRKKSVHFDKLVHFFEAKAKKNAKLVYRYELIGLIILVAIPLPGTGAWTGALVASFLDIRLKTAIPAIFCGVVIAGLIMCTLSWGLFSFI